MEAYIYDAIRTPRGKGKTDGALYEIKPIDLLATVLEALKERNQLDTSLVEDMIIGCVNPIGDQGSNIAKAALLYAGWASNVSGLQLNRFGASGLEAVNLGAMKIRSGWGELLLAGGVESMSRTPIGSDGGPMRFDPDLVNTINAIPQGIAADLIATIEGFDRLAVDSYALQSQARALHAQKEGYFQQATIPIYDNNGLLILEEDECLYPETTMESLGELKPAFTELGQWGYDEIALHKYPTVEKVEHVHTAGNSSGIVDGAALLLLGSLEKGKALGLKPRAKIKAAATTSVEPTIMLTGPTSAAKKALSFAGMQPQDIQLWECHEAFAAIPLKFQRDLDIDPELLNVNGGAIALGHPLGASGAILLGGLLDELERRDLQFGLLSVSANGGMGVSTIIERV